MDAQLVARLVVFVVIAAPITGMIYIGLTAKRLHDQEHGKCRQHSNP